MFREGQAPRPTKSEWDSADTEAYRAYRRSFTKSDGDNAEKAVTATSCDRFLRQCAASDSAFGIVSVQLRLAKRRGYRKR